MRDCLLVVFPAHRLLLLRVQGPGELVKAVIEVVGQVGARFAPGLVVVREVLVDVELGEGLAGCFVDRDAVDVDFGDSDGRGELRMGLGLLFGGFLTLYRGWFERALVGGGSLRDVADFRVFGLSVQERLMGDLRG